jgi:Domain of unknown function (DUF1993)
VHDRFPSTRRPSRHQDSLHVVIDVLGVHSGVRDRAQRPICYLDKAAAFAASKKIDPSVLVSWRLAPDMFALARQVQVAADQAKNGCARLTGVEAPRFEDNENTIEQLKARLPVAWPCEALGCLAIRLPRLAHPVPQHASPDRRGAPSEDQGEFCIKRSHLWRSARLARRFGGRVLMWSAQDRAADAF